MVRIGNEQRARILASLGSVPQRLVDLCGNHDLHQAPVRIQAEIDAAKRDGWPIVGNSVSGYRLVWGPSVLHRAMRLELQTAGQRLYGGGHSI